MLRQTTLDNVEEVRVINDKPIRLLLLAEATSNLGFIIFVFLYPSSFLAFLFQPADQITPLASYLLIWLNSWLFVITGLMYAAVPSKYNTPTLTAGLIHVRRFLYWGLLFSEIILAFLLFYTSHRTIVSIGCGIFLVLVVIGRLIVLFAKQAWFGTVVIKPPRGEDKQR